MNFDNIVKVIERVHWHFLLNEPSLGPSKKAPKGRNDFLESFKLRGIEDPYRNQ